MRRDGNGFCPVSLLGSFLTVCYSEGAPRLIIHSVKGEAHLDCPSLCHSTRVSRASLMAGSVCGWELVSLLGLYPPPSFPPPFPCQCFVAMETVITPRGFKTLLKLPSVSPPTWGASDIELKVKSSCKCFPFQNEIFYLFWVIVAAAQKTICQITYKARAGTLKFYSLQVRGSRVGNEQPRKSYFSPS